MSKIIETIGKDLADKIIGVPPLKAPDHLARLLRERYGSQQSDPVDHGGENERDQNQER